MTGSGPPAKRGGLAFQQSRARYDQLWSDGIRKIRAGKIELDKVLQAGLPDRRRGLTVIARPAPMVRQRVADLVRELRRLEPEQYYYHASEFHVTVLSLFTATVGFEPFFALKDRYVAAIDKALEGVEPVRILFQGVTVSPGTVMVQGFCEEDRLNRLRDALRHQLGSLGLDQGLDQRYRLQTAHMTVVRFRAALRISERFVSALEQARCHSFGASVVQKFELAEHDWYMSRRNTRLLKTYG